MAIQFRKIGSFFFLWKVMSSFPCLPFFIPERSFSIPSMDETLINATLFLMYSWDEFWGWSINILESWLKAYMISWKEWQWPRWNGDSFSILLDRFICFIVFLTVTSRRKFKLADSCYFSVVWKLLTNILKINLWLPQILLAIKFRKIQWWGCQFYLQPSGINKEQIKINKCFLLFT